MVNKEGNVEEPSYTLAYRFKRILVPVTPQPHTQQAIDVAVDLAQRYGSHIVFLYVARSEDDPSIKEVKEMVKQVERYGVVYEFKVRMVKEGETVPSEIVKELSEERYDLVIMSTRGYYGVAALIYESVSITIAIAANTSVLILR